MMNVRLDERLRPLINLSFFAPFKSRRPILGGNARGARRPSRSSIRTDVALETRDAQREPNELRDLTGTLV